MDFDLLPRIIDYYIITILEFGIFFGVLLYNN